MTSSEAALGATATTTGGVSGAGLLVDLGSIDSEADVAVRRYQYDDERDAVELSISSPVSMTISLDPTEADELAEAIAAAVEE